MEIGGLVTLDDGGMVTVEIGGPVNISCSGNSTFDDVTVSWIQIVNGEEKSGTYLLTVPMLVKHTKSINVCKLPLPQCHLCRT